MSQLRKIRLIFNKFRGRLSKSKVVVLNRPSTHSDNGIMYIAFGNSYTKEALMSIESLKRYNNEPLALFTDCADIIKTDLPDFTYQIEPTHTRSKIDYIQKSPFAKTLYLDSDTIINRNISDVFEVLTKYNVAVTIDTGRKRLYIADLIPEYKDIPYAFSEINGGVLGFKSSDNTKRFLELWKMYFYKYYVKTNGWDQPSLRIALWESGIEMLCLPTEYNVRPKSLIKKVNDSKNELGPGHMEPRIYHMHYYPEVCKGIYYDKSLEEVEKIIKKESNDIIY